MIDNQPLLRGHAGRTRRRQLAAAIAVCPGTGKYLDGCPPASYVPEERVKMLDEWGVDAGVLFPTVGILWDVADNDLATAYARAYNNWITDFASRAQGRVIPIAHLALAGSRRCARGTAAMPQARFQGNFPCAENRSTAGASRIPTSIQFGTNVRKRGIPVCLHVIVRFNRAPGTARQLLSSRAIFEPCTDSRSAVSRRWCPRR